MSAIFGLSLFKTNYGDETFGWWGFEMATPPATTKQQTTSLADVTPV